MPFFQSAYATTDYTIIDLGTFSGISQGWGINDSGQVVGYSVNNSNDNRAFLWENGTMQDLGDLGGSSGKAYGINDSMQIAGQSMDASGTQRAFLRENGTMNSLGTLGGSSSMALGINNSGQVVGHSKNASGTQRAFLYDNETMRDLNDLLPEDSAWTLKVSYDINNSGQIIGYGNVGSDSLPYLWSAESGLIDLSTYLGSDSNLRGFNDYGQIVGYSIIAGISTPFLLENGTVRDLNDLLPVASGWTLKKAFDINNSGDIVGYGLNPDGDRRAFRMTVAPEPASTTLFLAGVIPLFLYRSKNRYKKN